MTFFQPGQQAYCQAVGTSKTNNNVIFQRDPTSDDVLYPIGIFWQNQLLENLWYLNSFTSAGGILQAEWVLISVESILVSLSGSDTPNIPVFASTTSSPLKDNIQLTNLDGSMTITSDPGNNRIIFTAVSTPVPFPWQDKSTIFIAEVNKGYFCTAALIVTLPVSPVEGDEVDIAVDSSGAVIIQASAGQTIRLAALTTSGPAGTATSTAIGSSLQLVFRLANKEWFSISTEGSWILS